MGSPEERGMTPSIFPLRIENLVYEVGERALLRGITAEIGATQRTVILGPNGAGKSLLLRLCHGLLAPTGGRVVWQGRKEGAAIRDQAMVFQRPVTLRRSVAANVAYALAIRGVSRGPRRLRVDEVLARTGLTAKARVSARVLSGGEQQRLALARAWASRPQVLFLDEPTANLDPAATRAVEEVILEIQASGTKIVMTTHDLGQARRLGEEILFLCDGRLVERKPADRFFAGPESPEAAAFIEGRLTW
ncbi:MAG: ATP-binding cassette domain-containing protein [Alphaproteobacteria bacterium]|nr:ATP-binding cassette domain-containing protein [Alphaproteobacteria bacterium]